jgi:hypothetical protein
MEGGATVTPMSASDGTRARTALWSGDVGS